MLLARRVSTCEIKAFKDLLLSSSARFHHVAFSIIILSIVVPT